MTRALLVFASAALLTIHAAAQGSRPASGQAPATVQPAASLKWGPPPPGLPKGAEMAVLKGDPGGTGDYAIIARMPDGYVFPPHVHSRDENVVVVSGTILLGVGPKFDENGVTALGSGSLASFPAGTIHYARAKGPTTIVVYGSGPFDFVTK